jgi:diamine N-acetyltransferase
MTLPSIRRATSSDAAALSAFAASVFALGCPQTAPTDLAAYITTELSSARFLLLLEDPNIIVLLAESSRRIVAYMVVVRRSSHASLSTPVSAEFRKLYVDPIYHGTGLASALLHCALSIIQSEAPRPIWLSVFSENPRAISFYKKWGFEVVGTQEFLVGTDRQKDFLMQRPATACASTTH